MPNPKRAVWFHRAYAGLTGGQVKHAHYFDHARRMPGFAAKITFTDPADGEAAADGTALARERDRLWRPEPGERAAAWAPGPADVLFLAGTDWRYLHSRGMERPEQPVLNLIQHVRHADAGTELRGYLANRALRICVSEEVALAIGAVARTNGPVLTIPNGTDLTPAPGAPRRRHPIAIVGYKRPALARAVAAHLNAADAAHVASLGFLDRAAFLSLLADSAVAVCLPNPQEGFYLPAVEAMARGCVVVTLDCVGNRGFCRHAENCLVAPPDAAAIAEAAVAATALAEDARTRLLAAAAATVARHSLTAERARFHEVLANVDAIWRTGAMVPKPRREPATVDDAKPILDFAIVGAQKSGTTALARFLGQHPGIHMCEDEAHVFDDPQWNDDASVPALNARYRGALGESGGAGGRCPDALRGEKTPIYMYLPEVAARLRRYNPDLKLIALLRDPAERAISEYHMQRQRGEEKWPLWLALALEPFRLAKDSDPLAHDSATRSHSYRNRGKYREQLANLRRHFGAAQILVVRTRDLRERHDASLRQVFRFLEVAEDVQVPPALVFTGRRKQRHPLTRLVLKLLFLRESRALRRLEGATGRAH